MLYESIKKLVQYGIDTGLTPECERVYTTNLLLELFHEDNYEDIECTSDNRDLEEILKDLLDEAVKRGIIEDSITYRDLFDTKIMNCLMPRPSQIQKEFQENVINYFVDEYLCGRTPNPCIACNRYVKWESLLQRSLQIGADYIATGHYARIEQLANGRYAIRNSVTAKKDQTYALYNLTQEQLSRTLMPVGDYTKDEIRKIASEIGIQVANKPDSMEICFVPDNDYAGFIQRETDYIPKEGNFVDIHGNVIGKHKGIIHYTVGQRKGLGLAMGHPVFVTEIRPDTNEVVIGENADVFASKLYANKLNFMAAEAFTGDVRAKAKIRYSHAGADCTVRMINEDTLECVFDEPQRAVTPGQALVLYDGEYVLGGGTIIGKAVE